MKLDLKELIAKVTGHTEFKTLLWTNTQGGQTEYIIPIDKSKYDFLDVVVERYGNIQTARIPTSAASGEIYALYDSYQTGRAYTLSATKLTFHNGYYYSMYLGSTAKTYGTGYCLPSKVYGVKLVGGYCLAVFSRLLAILHRTCLGVM